MPGGTFAVNTTYTAAIVLRAAAGYKFTGTINPTTGGIGTPSPGTISGGDRAENTLTFTVSFPATEPEPNTGIPVGDPSVKLYLNGGTAPLAHNGTTSISMGTGTYTISIDSGAYTEIIWHLNGNPQTQAQGNTSIILSKRTAGNYLVTVEATPSGGVKNSGAHTFVVQ
jgi:hypothetical protein